MAGIYEAISVGWKPDDFVNTASRTSVDDFQIARQQENSMVTSAVRGTVFLPNQDRRTSANLTTRGVLLRNNFVDSCLRTSAGNNISISMRRWIIRRHLLLYNASPPSKPILYSPQLICAYDHVKRGHGIWMRNLTAEATLVPPFRSRLAACVCLRV